MWIGLDQAGLQRWTPRKFPITPSLKGCPAIMSGAFARRATECLDRNGRRRKPVQRWALQDLLAGARIRATRVRARRRMPRAPLGRHRRASSASGTAKSLTQFARRLGRVHGPGLTARARGCNMGRHGAGADAVAWR